MEDYTKYSKEELIDIITYIDSPVKNFDDVAIKLCETLSCENCPVVIHGCDRRTQYEKEMLHSPCCTQLYHWILNESRLIDK